MKQPRPCIFGEVLFDHFPDRTRVLGGAPFNVAWHLQAFGQRPRFISRVGNDPEGEEVRNAMRAWGMDIGGLQSDPELPTGRVDVGFIDGEPRYDIVEPCAYDAIEAPEDGEDCGLLYHGSLALRGSRSRQALAACKRHAPRTLFVDVNLRPPWWRIEALEESLQGADWIKLNAEELAQLHPTVRAGSDRAESFLRAHELRGLIVTHGAHGAEILTARGERFTATPEASPKVVDTVGAGDAFAAVTILGILRHWPLELTLQRAQAFASRIVQTRGATVHDRAVYASLASDWNIAT